MHIAHVPHYKKRASSFVDSTVGHAIWLFDFYLERRIERRVFMFSSRN